MKRLLILLTILLFLLPVNYLFSQFADRVDRIERSTLSDTIANNLCESSFADTLFNFAKKSIDILDYDDCNNCDIRAHTISIILDEKFSGIKFGKAWLFADSKRSTKKSYYEQQGYSILSNSGDCFNWGFHVAPFLIIAKDTFVIDPSTQNSAVTLKKWSNDIIPSGFKGFLVVKNIKYYSFPSDDLNYFIDTCKDWAGFLGENIIEDDKSELAEKITIAYHGFFEPTRYNYYKNKISKIIEN